MGIHRIRDDQIWAHLTWEQYHGTKADWSSKKKEWACLSRIIKSCGENFRMVWETYLRNDEKFFAGHEPSKLSPNVDRFLADAKRIRECLPPDPKEAALIRENRALREYWEKR